MERYTIDNLTFGFSVEAIRNRYLKKEDFVQPMLEAYPTVKTKLKKVLDKVWDEAFPQKEV